jgi:hypothetical protein
MVPKVSFTADMPAYEYALYEGASQWEASAPTRILAQLGERFSAARSITPATPSPRSII